MMPVEIDSSPKLGGESAPNTVSRPSLRCSVFITLYEEQMPIPVAVSYSSEYYKLHT